MHNINSMDRFLMIFFQIALIIKIYVHVKDLRPSAHSGVLTKLVVV